MAAATNDEKNYNLRFASFKQQADDLLAGSSPVVKIICASLGFGYLLSFTGKSSFGYPDHPSRKCLASELLDLDIHHSRIHRNTLVDRLMQCFRCIFVW